MTIAYFKKKERNDSINKNEHLSVPLISSIEWKVFFVCLFVSIVFWGVPGFVETGQWRERWGNPSLCISLIENGFSPQHSELSQCSKN